MTLKVLKYRFSVCKVKDSSEIDFNENYIFTAKTNDEISLICPVEYIPENCTAHADGWKAFRIKGSMDFNLTGILSKISDVIAAEKIGILAVSTFNTDYVFTKEENFEKAISALADAGYEVER